MKKVWCDICEQPLDRHDPETVECVGPDHKGGIFMHKQCRLRKLRVRIEWLRNDYPALKKITDADRTPEDTLAWIEYVYKWEVQYCYPDEAKRPQWLKEDLKRVGFAADWRWEDNSDGANWWKS